MTRSLGATALLTALALVAGCAGSTAPAPRAAGPGTDEHSAAQPTIRRADLELEYTLDAVTRRSTSIAIVPHDQLRFVPRNGTAQQSVRAGSVVGRLTVSQAARAALSAGSSGGSASRLAGLAAQEREVRAPVDSVLHPAGPTPSFVTAGLDVVATLTPIQYLRYLSMPFTGTARIETVLGPTTVTCLALWTTPVAEAAESAAALHCRVPAGVQTAPGLRSTLTMGSAGLKDVLLAPNLSIGYDEKADRYFVEAVRGDATVRVPVEVGATDGVVRVVRGKVSAGDVLAPPDVTAPAPDPAP